MRLLVLLTDAFGGKGGIAKFNRDLLTVLCGHPAADEIVALPRVMPEPVTRLMPERLTYLHEAAGSKGKFVRAVVRVLRGRSAFDGVVCGHLNLLPLAALAARWKRVPLLLIIHGIDAWEPPRGKMGWLTRRAIARLDGFVAVSGVTRDRFLAWTGLDPALGTVVPNCIDASLFGQGPKRDDVLDRYGLAGRTILLTLGRLSAAERYKGFDEVMEVLPALAESVPDIAYLIVGDGDDRDRLERKAAALGVSDRVVFAGYIPEEEKADHYRLADAFVMPGRGEGFGIVYLEAMACGVPVVASALDASREAVRDGALGQVVDPDDAEDIRRGILAALHSEREVPDGLEYFSFERFQERWFRVTDQAFQPHVSAAGPSDSATRAKLDNHPRELASTASVSTSEPTE